MRKFLRSGSDEDVNGNISQYDLGMVLKETMLNLGPTFIKGQKFLSDSKC
jgi:aarF domain-containing kinase